MISKTKVKRSRTGCFTCRKRKKKCDESDYPICKNCQSKSLSCKWPLIKQEFYQKLQQVRYVEEKQNTLDKKGILERIMLQQDVELECLQKKSPEVRQDIQLIKIDMDPVIEIQLINNSIDPMIHCSNLSKDPRLRHVYSSRQNSLTPISVSPDSVSPDSIQPHSIRPDSIRPDSIRPDSIRRQFLNLPNEPLIHLADDTHLILQNVMKLDEIDYDTFLSS
jgi:hypothetical protein